MAKKVNVKSKIIPHDGELTIMIEAAGDPGTNENEIVAVAEKRVMEIINQNRKALFRYTVTKAAPKGKIVVHCNARVEVLGYDERPILGADGKLSPYVATWIKVEESISKSRYRCSACNRVIVSGREAPDLVRYRHCPGCGARMKIGSTQIPKNKLEPSVQNAPHPHETYKDWEARLAQEGKQITESNRMAYWGRLISEGLAKGLEGKEDNE